MHKDQADTELRGTGTGVVPNMVPGPFCDTETARGDTNSDPDLARVIDAWPALPRPIKAAIRALIQAVE